MTPADAKQIREALASFGAKTKVIKEDRHGNIWKVSLPFTAYRGDKFRFYAFRNDNKILFSDGGILLRTIKGCGQPQLDAVQRLVESFGLSLMEDLSIMDNSKRILSIRVLSFLQAWCAVDGMVRIWEISREDVKDALLAAS